MDARDAQLLERFLAGLGKRDLYDYYGLDRLAPTDEIDAAIRRRRQWAQGQQSNPKFRTEALFLIKNQALVRRALVDEPEAYRATLAAPEAAEPEDADALPLEGRAIEVLPFVRPRSAEPSTLPIPSHSAVLPPDDSDLYAVLGASRGADPEDLILAYRDRIRFLRFALAPDQFRGSLARVEAAWRVLSDPPRRAAYDAGEPLPPPSFEQLDEPPTEMVEAVTQVIPAGALGREPPLERTTRSRPVPRIGGATAEPRSPDGRTRPRAAPAEHEVARSPQLEVDAPEQISVALGATPHRIRLVIRNRGVGRMGGRIVSDRPWLEIPSPILDADATEQTRTVSVDPARFPGEQGVATLQVVTEQGERRSIQVSVQRGTRRDWPMLAGFGAAALAMFVLGFWWVSRDLGDDLTLLRLRIEPPATHVYVDGRERGAGSQVDLELPTGGAYRLRVEAEGFDPHEELLEGLSGGPTERRIRLAPADDDARAIVPLGADAQALVASREPELRTCYAGTGAPAGVRAEIVLFVAGSGVTREVRIEGATWTNPEAEACVRNVLSTLTFPTFDGQTGTVRRPVALTDPGAP